MPTGACPIVAVAVLIAAGGCAVTPRPVTSPTADHRAPSTASIDSIFRAYSGPVPGASVAVIHDGSIAFSRSYGLADLETRAPVDEHTTFRLASLTKEFTATAILLLAHDGRLSLDEPVREILPELPVYASSVTVRHLLTHTSGLWAYEDFVPDSQTAQVHDSDVPALIAHASALYFSPGSQHRYSNTGYALLALIVERRSGMPFARFLRERIFDPLDMKSTVAYEAGISTVPHRGFGHSATADGFMRTDQSSTSAVLGDGGVYSSVHDLLLWDAAMDRHALVDEPTQRAMWTPARLNDGSRSRYGFGWFIDSVPGGIAVSHHGETMGFTNFIVKYPSRRLTVLVLTNRTGGAPWDLALRVAALYGAPPVETP